MIHLKVADGASSGRQRLKGCRHQVSSNNRSNNVQLKLSESTKAMNFEIVPRERPRPSGNLSVTLESYGHEADRENHDGGRDE